MNPIMLFSIIMTYLLSLVILRSIDVIANSKSIRILLLLVSLIYGVSVFLMIINWR